MGKPVRLYNIILPLWLLMLFPQMLPLTLPANLLVDAAVLFIALCLLKNQRKGAVFKKLWWRIWLLGFAADLIGVAWMILGLLLEAWLSGAGELAGSAFASVFTFLWTLSAVAIAGTCIWLFDRRAMRSCQLLEEREKRRIALALAILTAPWLFFLPAN